MKRLLLSLLLSIILTTPALAGEKTLFGGVGPMVHGGFGGPVVKFTEIDGEYGVLVGGRGGWIINHTLSIGGGGYGLANEIKPDLYYDPSMSWRPANEPKLNFGYGGFELEYIMRSKELVHFSFQTLIGGGSVELDSQSLIDQKDEFFIAEPGANIMINVAPYFRVGLGGSYRFVSGIDLSWIENKDLSGFSGVLTLKFGKF